jgi:nucleoside-diphosphate-sugar epimerase
MVLVTGATGFLGSHLLYHLLLHGKNIRALKRASSRFEILKNVFAFHHDDLQNYQDRIEWVEADITDVYGIRQCVSGISELYHTAALVSFQPNDRKKLININIEGTANVVNAALENNVSRFCHVSSIAAIGRADNNQVIDENVVWKSSGRNSNYAVSKYGSEREIWRGIEEGLNAVIINPSIILGPGEINSGTARLISTVLGGLKFFPPGINGFVDVRDVAEIMIKLMEMNISGERFIVSSENITYKDLFQTLAGLLHKPPPIYKASQWMSGLAWRYEFIKGKVSGSKPLITKETTVTANNKYIYSNKKIKDLLNRRYIPVEETLKESCDFYLNVIKS